ncbi:MAG: helix-turn-helix transcriptional regulator [Lachnospiraceae bacterium]|nr:helix-turn-helix transcriptional regulator [Lachnospiraceae bacterium]
MSGAALSAASGVAEASISRYLRGLRAPTAENLMLLSSALNVSTDYLLGFDGTLDDRALTAAFSIASDDDRRVIWTLLERYGEKNGIDDANWE